MNTLTDALHIPDTQSERDERHLAIQRVGVKDVRYPLNLRVAGAVQSTAALWNLDVALPAEKKGTHMSRFVAWLDAQSEPLDAAGLARELDVMLDKLGASDGRIEALAVGHQHRIVDAGLAADVRHEYETPDCRVSLSSPASGSVQGNSDNHRPDAGSHRNRVSWLRAALKT